MQVEAEPLALQAAHAVLREASDALRALPPSVRADAIAQAARELSQASSSLGRELRAELALSSGLSAEAIEFGLQTTLGLFERDALLGLFERETSLARAPGTDPQRLCVAVLAGNVFSAAVRPLLFPLLCGHAVLAKASSADAALPRALERALAAIEPTLARACAVTCFAHGDRECEAALLAGADVVSIYGSDETLAALSARVPAAARIVAHGHGGGAIWIAADALHDLSEARGLALRAALDVAAYDQRGCLSPQAVLVERGARVCARDFAQLLCEALAVRESQMPRGALPQDVLSEQTQWRGVAAALFEPFASADGRACVSYEHSASLRGSPGHRNMSVYEVAGEAELCARLSALGPRIKALGIAGIAAGRQLSGLAPYVCAVGAMQTPPLGARLDGLDPLAAY